MKIKTALALLSSALIAGSVFSADNNARGKSLYHSTPYQRSGVILGGIGSGYVELRSDGGFPDWAIYNRGQWAYRADYMAQNRSSRAALPEMNDDSLQFFILARPADGSRPVARRLGTVGTHMGVYTYNTWLQNVESIDADQTFPGMTLYYNDPALPLEVSGQFFSPIIPHELRVAGTPGFYAVFTIKNTSDKAQDVSLASYLRNPLARSLDAVDRFASKRKLKSSVKRDGDLATLTLRTDSDTKHVNTLGSLSFSVQGGEPSWIGMDFGNYLQGRTMVVKQWNQRYETAMRAWRFSGILPGTNPQVCPTEITAMLDVAKQQMIGGEFGALTDSPAAAAAKRRAERLAKKNPAALKLEQQRQTIATLTEEQVAGIIEKAGQVASLQSIIQQAKDVDPDYLDPKKRGRELVDAIAQIVALYAGDNNAAPTWGDSMLNTKITLAPGETREIKFVLSWYFPNHISPLDGRNMGHMYSHWFKDSEEVNDFLVKNYGDFSKKVNEFRSLMRDNTLPPKLTDAISAQLSTLICSSAWNADNKTGIWEGLGTMGYNPATCYEHGSHPVAALFPEFQKLVTANSIIYQNDTTGRMYILLPNDLNNGRKNAGYGYVDRNSHFVWMVGRDYLWFGDKEFLKKYYPRIVLSMGVFGSPEMDTDGDGLPDTHTESNTYDTWELQGTSSYMSSLWIVALRTAIRMAEDYGDLKNAAKWKSVLERAVKSMEAKLWNGEYYSLWYDHKKPQSDGSPLRDEGCMVDQIIGEYYTRLLGLGNTLDKSRVHAALAAIYKYNFDPEHGLHNGIYPPHKQPRFPTYQNVQGQGNWTGIEHNAIAMYIDHGLIKEGLDILDAVHQRYMRAGRYPNHHECGDRYIRPLSIWAALLAITGYKIDYPLGILTIAPPYKQETMTAPWVSATGLGSFTRTDKTFDFTCKQGEMPIRELRVNIPVKTVSLNGKQVAVKIGQTADQLTSLRFETPVTLKPNDTLKLR